MNVMKKAHNLTKVAMASLTGKTYKEIFRLCLIGVHAEFKQMQNILNAKYDQFETANTHELKQGDIIRHYGMVIVVGEKKISDKGSHADNGYGCAHYHISEIVASAPGAPTGTWNVQGNRLAKWERFIG